MSLMKWFRKNNTKIMAIVVVILLVGFIGGTALQQILQGFSLKNDKTVAYYGQKKKITQSKIYQAQRELEILKMIGAPTILRNIPAFPAIMGNRETPAFTTMLLGELIFEDVSASGQLSSHIKQTAIMQRYTVSNKQINDIYRRTQPAYLYWFLLKQEAKEAGIIFPKEYARSVLARIIPSMYQNQITYSQFIQILLNPSSNTGKVNVTEDELLTTFADLMAVWEYARIICSNEDVTEQQIKHTMQKVSEPMNIEFVRFNSVLFTDDVDEPTEQKIQEQFEKYKNNIPGKFYEQNPYGFGYKLADRVQMQYLAIKIDDVETITEKPTQEDGEKFYRNNINQLKERVRSDPNDPNSALVERQLKYPEIADMIYEKLFQDRVYAKTNEILQEAKLLTQSEEVPDYNNVNPSEETLTKINDMFESAADKLSKKFQIPVYAGKTGLLNPIDFYEDPVLGTMYMEGPDYDQFTNPQRYRLSTIAFSVEPLNAGELGAYDVQKAVMFQNFGPLKDIYENIRMIAQVINIAKETVPENIDVSFSIETTNINEPNESEEKIFSIKENVIEDLKKLDAMKVAGSEARQLARRASETTWEQAIDRLNQLYPPQDVNEPNTFKLQNLTGIVRGSDMDIETLEFQAMGNPAAGVATLEIKKEKALKDKLYSIIPADSNSLKETPYVLEFKPDMSYYCIKKLYKRIMYQNEYELYKGAQMYAIDVGRTQSAAVMHYNPENILERMNFKLAKQPKAVQEPNDITDTAQ